MEGSGFKLGQDLSQIYVWSMQDLDMVEPWYTQDPDMIKLWCTQDPYIDQYAGSYMVKADLGMVMYVYIYVFIT